MDSPLLLLLRRRLLLSHFLGNIFGLLVRHLRAEFSILLNQTAFYIYIAGYLC